MPVAELDAEERERLHRVDDICSLENVSETLLLGALSERYARDTIYTRISQMILVAANPFKELAGEYSESRLQDYAAAADPATMPPHVFGLTRQALQETASGKDQAVIISGESGAGKTETAKLILRALAAGGPDTGGGEDSSAQDLLLRAGPALEAFGNAATARNKNSSRFGKWLDVLLAPSRGGGRRVCGCALAHYLLETTRVCTRAPGERNFHVFHQLLAGPPELLQALGLRQAAGEYRYLRPGPGSDAAGPRQSSYAEDFGVLRASLAAFGVEGDAEHVVLGVLGAILELGNLDFGAAEGAEPVPELEGEDRSCLERAAALLGVGAEELSGCLRLRRLAVTRDAEDVPVPARQARAARDSLARHLYGSLFSWLLGRINARLQPRETGCRSFGILDMAGFEDFEQNSLEQLLINSSNEWLQQAFNECVIKVELEDCRREGIPVDGLDSFEADNLDCLQLIGVTPGSIFKVPGILDVLEDTAALPKIGDPDSRFVAALVKQHGGRHNRFKAPRFGGAKFTVRHFAGDIEYTCGGWVEKSTDRPPERAVELLTKSRLELVRSLGDGMQGACAADSGRRKAPSSIVRPFRASLRALMEKIRNFELRFVRCIKPNDEGLPGTFREAKVVEQLRCGGILEAVRIRKSGYRFRWPHAEFAAHFGCCVSAMAGAGGGGSSSSSSSASSGGGSSSGGGGGRGSSSGGTAMGAWSPSSSIGELVRELQAAFGLAPDELVVGTTKVLARERAAAALEGARSHLCEELVLRLRSAAQVQHSRRLLLRLRAEREAAERQAAEVQPPPRPTPEPEQGTAPAAIEPAAAAEEPPAQRLLPTPLEPAAPEGPAGAKAEASAAVPPVTPKQRVSGGISSLRARFERSPQRTDTAAAPATPTGPRPLAAAPSSAMTARLRSFNQSSNQKQDAKREVAAALQSGEKAALEQAVKKGEAAGLDAQELREVRNIISKLRQQDSAREVLAKAVDSRDERQLLNAIARGERAGLQEQHLRVARELREELLQEVALRELSEAVRQRDVRSLREALRRVEQLQVASAATVAQVSHAQKLLRELEVLASLQDAHSRNCLAQLRAGLGEAEALGIESARLSNFRRAAALIHLDNLQASRTIELEELQAAIDAAQALGLPVQRPRQLMSVLGLIRDALASRDMPALQTAIEAGQVHGVSEPVLNRARQALAEERQRRLREAAAARAQAVLGQPKDGDEEGEACAICFETTDVLVMQCCGREASSNVVCPDCAARLSRCPFCRAANMLGQ